MYGIHTNKVELLHKCFFFLFKKANLVCVDKGNKYIFIYINTNVRQLG